MSMTYADAHKILMDELRLYHSPIALTFLFDDASVEEFKEKHEVYSPLKPMTFCQWELAARMKGQTVLATKDNLACSNGMVSFGWKDLDEAEYKTQLKYVRDLAQSKKFSDSKPRLPLGKLKALGLAPLGDAKMPPSTVHFYCDNMQSYHLAVDWMAATDIHPLRANITMSSSACGGNVYSYLEKHANILPSCSGSYNSGKTERGEVNVIIPGEHILMTVERLLERKRVGGSSSVTKPGDPFPGADICKNCPLIIFKKEKGA